MSKQPTAMPEDTSDIDVEWVRFAKRLVIHRKKAKLSQRALAERAEMSTSFVSNIEARAQDQERAANPSLVTILRLAQALGIPAYRLFIDD